MLYLDDVLGWLEQRSPARVAVVCRLCLYLQSDPIWILDRTSVTADSQGTPWSLPLGGARASRSTGAWRLSRLNKRK